jgi:hypothetical protein
MGQSRRFDDVRATSAFPPIAAKERTSRDVSNVPLPELAHHWLPRTSLRAISRILEAILWIAAAEPFSPTEGSLQLIALGNPTKGVRPHMKTKLYQ